ncbi:MAG: (d)CMP kinase [Syntrophorhabdaceae bacterium]|nr:(d)CMP kinase [Syntrophorhabdaceae bacterium]
MRTRPVVTIDGPSGAGKSVVSKRLAELAGMVRLDTGAMYRACALAARRAGVPWSDAVRLGELAKVIRLSFNGPDGQAGIFLDGEDISGAIRAPEMSMGASEVSVHLPVREAMVSKQRELGRDGGVVLEGRDTGTVVFPDAEVKFFLDAAAAVRALRRYREINSIYSQPYEQVLKEVLCRDVRDSTRKHSPLKMASGARYIDSTTMTVDEVVETMMKELPGGGR